MFGFAVATVNNRNTTDACRAVGVTFFFCAVSSIVSPLAADENSAAFSVPITAMPSLVAAISKLKRVRVDGS